MPSYTGSYGGPQVTVRFESSGGGRIPKGQPGAGQFTGKGSSAAFRAEMREANQRMALELQAEVVEALEDSIIRRSVSSGRLMRVTASRGNIQATDSFFGVGVVDYLDDSIAKYWRQIEEGYSGHVGRELRGLWGATINRVTATNVYAGPAWTPHRANRRGDMFLPVSSRTRLREGGTFKAGWSGSGGKGGAPNFVGTTTIKQPISAHGYYARAYRNYQPGQRALAEVMAAIRRASMKGHMLWDSR